MSLRAERSNLASIAHARVAEIASSRKSGLPDLRIIDADLG